MAKRTARPTIAVYKPPKPKTPIGKLKASLRTLYHLNSATNPEMGYDTEPKIKLPADVERAAKQITKHIDRVVEDTRKTLKGG